MLEYIFIDYSQQQSCTDLESWTWLGLTGSETKQAAPSYLVCAACSCSHFLNTYSLAGYKLKTIPTLVRKKSCNFKDSHTHQMLEIKSSSVIILYLHSCKKPKLYEIFLEEYLYQLLIKITRNFLPSHWMSLHSQLISEKSPAVTVSGTKKNISK